jgi:hypothetical protein
MYLGEKRHSVFEELLQECDQCLMKPTVDLESVQRASKVGDNNLAPSPFTDLSLFWYRKGP